VLLVAAVLISGVLPGVALADDPPANVPPVAVDDPGAACGNGTTGGSFPIPEDWGDWFLIFGECSLLYNDTDEDGDSLTWELLDGPAHGEVIDVPDLGFAYRPAPDWSTLPGDVPGGDWVSDSFTYRAFDGTDHSEPATMRFWIVPVNDPPTFTPGPELIEVDEDSGPYSAVWATDVSPGPPNESYQTVTFEIISVEPDDPDLFAVPPSIDADGVLTFTPAADRFGYTWVTYRLIDDGGLEDYDLSHLPEFTPPRDATDEDGFGILVNGVLDDAVATDDEFEVGRDSGPNVLDVLLNDSDIDGDLAVGSVEPGQLGTTAVTAGGLSVTYTPDPGASGVDTFSYTLTAGVSATVIVTISGPNRDPVANDDDLAVTEDAAASFDPRTNDSDPDDDPLTITGTTNGTKGSVAVTGGGTGVTYTPLPNANGSDSFTYTISDGQGGTDSATVTVAIAAVNDVPDAKNDTATVAQGAGPTAIDVIANDTDADDDPLTITARTNGAHGTVVITGGGSGLTYSPNPMYHGSDTFTYTVSDGHGGTDTATVLVTVTRDTAAPVLGGLTQSIPNQTVGASTVKLKLAWSGSDPGSGIASYQLQVSRNGGPWRTLSAPGATATASTRTVVLGSAYRYRIRATDAMGNRSSYVMWPALTPTRYQEGASRLAWTRSWSRAVNRNLSGGQARYTSAASRKVVLTFTGRDVAWVTARRPSSGRAQVRIDGVLVATVDLRASSTLFRRTIFRHHFPTRATHTLEIRPLGDGRIDVDAFIVLR
jgi:hypothetical protein